MTCLCGGPEELCEWPGRRAFHGFYPGQIVITEGGRKDIVSRMVAWATGSWFTHCFIVTGEDEIVEAYVPRVRKRSLIERLRELKKEDRAYYVLEVPKITLSDRCQLSKMAHSYVGRFYDLGQALLFGIARKFINDGTGTVVCSRAITGIIKDALGVDIFEGKIDPSSARAKDLMQGECTPADLLASGLQVVKFKPSSNIRVSIFPIGS